jgi:hypothetical protein
MVKMYDAFGESKCWTDWFADPRFVIKERTVRTRLASGWSFEEAITKEVFKAETFNAFGESKTIKEWLNDPRCVTDSEMTIRNRIKLGWNMEEVITSPIMHPKYTAFNENKSLPDWLIDDRCVVDSTATLHSRINVLNYDVEKALTMAVTSKSNMQKELEDWLCAYVDFSSNNRNVISPKELDIFIPAYDFAIEFNGLFWHSEKFREKTYHHDKWKACKDQGITLLQVWEDDWLYKKPLVQNMILHRLGLSMSKKVFARKTTVCKNISKTEAGQFLDQNHIQGNHFSTSIYYGLKDNDVLVAVLGMKKLPDGWDLVRYATSESVIGGFGKLLKAFRSDHIGSIKTFADLCLSNGNLYEQTGFKLDSIIPPDYYYFKPPSGLRVHKFSMRKTRIKSNPVLLYEDGLTETELAKLNGYLKIYDAGKLKFILD